MKTGNKVGAGVAAGILVGVVAGLLLAPKSGKDNREMLFERTGQLRERVRKMRCHDNSESAMSNHVIAGN